ncbi:hypothetical protein RSAG8_09728, partial [Rhizoctonia solani AG-8 WAC10335]
MEGILRLEVNGAVYQYSKLCEEFFHVNERRVDEILAQLAGEPLLSRGGQWLIDCDDLSRGETEIMRHTCAKLLDVIMRAAFSPRPFRPVVQDIVHSRNILMVGDHSDDVATSPDIVQGAIVGEHRRHWGDLEFFGECKAGLTNLGDALMQIARYSRALFTHQIYRKYIFSVALCGTSATFVRITRSSLIHSPPIDLSTDPEAFIRAVAGLFALDDAKFGFNTLFYYWPPLDQKEEKIERELRFVTEKRRWTVVEILCHRMCLVGRATIVILLRRINHPQHHAVLKLIWRPSTRMDENDSLSMFKDCPGICRRRWGSCDGNTKVQDSKSLLPSAFQHLFVELSQEKRQDIHQSLKNPQSLQYNSLITVEKRKKARTHCDSDDRGYSMILMDEGAKLWRVKHLVHLLRVLRDAIIGYAHVVLRGKVHRDISEGNILCGPCNATELNDLWLDKEGESDLDSDSDLDNDGETLPNDTSARYNFDDVGFLLPEEKIDAGISFADYHAQRYSKQQPLGGLFDFEFVVDEAREENEVRSVADRTGTYAFMSVHILHAPEAQPIRHHFLHDIESFFWVFLWLVFIRAKMIKKLSSNNQEIFCKLFLLGNSEYVKRYYITFVPELRLLVRQLTDGNPEWKGADAFAANFACFLIKHLHPLPKGQDIDVVESLADDEEPSSGPSSGPKPAPEAEPQLPDMDPDEKWRLIRGLVDIFDQAIQQLHAKRQREQGVSGSSGS